MTDIFHLPPDFKIISGGQTGADSAGLDWAIANNVSHGGWCPMGRRSEDGRISGDYVLAETPTKAYLQRTEWNVRDSDATLIFTMDDKLDGGSKRTADFAAKLKKPWLHFRPGVHPKFIARFLAQHKVAVLNIAGRRASVAPEVHRFVTDSLSASLVPAGRVDQGLTSVG